MSEMVDRVARAIYASHPLETQFPATQEACRVQALAAIKAMREPTMDMVAAANRNNHPRDIETWQTMIDVACEIGWSR